MFAVQVIGDGAAPHDPSDGTIRSHRPASSMLNPPAIGCIDSAAQLPSRRTAVYSPS